MQRHHGCKIGWWSDCFTNEQCYVCWKLKDPANKKDRAAPAICCSRRTKLPASPDATTINYSKTGAIHLPVVLVNTLPCAFLGEAQPNQGCGCHEKLRACDIHGLCTTRAKRNNIPCCETCPDYRSVDDILPDRRHLLYYCYPVTINGLWQKNLDQLKARSSLFNGRRVIAISTGSHRHKLDDPKAVMEYLGKDFADYITVPHVKKLGEVTAFVDLLRRVKPFTTDHDFTFYGHTKGVTKPVNPGISVHRWGDLMYRANLDHWENVKEHLTRYPITGAFKKYGPCFGGRADWHYHGTFYWFRNKDVFAHPGWATVRQQYGGTELWPATLFTHDNSGCHFYGGQGFSMYNIPEVERAETAITCIPNLQNRDALESEMIAQLRAEVTKDTPTPVLSGRGVVTHTSRDYLPGTYVLIKMLRLTGWRGLIQVWHNRELQIPDIIASQPGVECYTTQTGEHGLHAQCDVLCNSGLKELFWIGSDAYPVQDITPWFDDLKICGNVMWRDSEYGEVFDPGRFGLPSDEGFMPQGDTLMFDMEKMWKTVSVWYWMNRRRSYFFPGQAKDQATLKAAIQLCKTPTHRFTEDRVVRDPHFLAENFRPLPLLPDIDPRLVLVYQHQSRDGITPGIIHRTRAKMIPGGEIKFPNLPMEQEAWSFYEEYKNASQLTQTTD